MTHPGEETFTLPPTMRLRGPNRVGQRRFDDLKVWSEKKRLGNLNYAHGNAMKNGASQLSLLVTRDSPLAIALVGGGSGNSSSTVTRHCFLGRGQASAFYFLKDDSVLPMDRLP